MIIFKRLIATFLLLIVNSQVFSQVSISINVKQTHTKLSKLYIFHGSETILVDSAYLNSQGSFTYNLANDYKQGVYKFTLGNNISFNFIVAAESSIDLETIIFAAEDSLKSIDSKENAIYFSYLKLKKDLNQKLWLINSLTDHYQDTSLFRKTLSIERFNAQQLLFNQSLKLAVDNPNLFVSNLILLELRPLSNPNLSRSDNRLYQKKNWWSQVNLNDERLINTSTLESKIWGFIDFCYNENYDKEQQDSSYIQGVKELMGLSSNNLVKQFIREVLFKNFIDSEYNNTTKYLVESKFDNLPTLNLSPEQKNAYELQSRNMVGSKVSDFKISQPIGNSVKLSKVKAQYKLIVFWSMWCPHCTEMIPELKSLYQNYKAKGLEVIAVCIDEEVNEWKNYVNEKGLNWVNTIETDNGKNEVISDYNIDGTPEFFLVDKGLTIVSRPTNIKQAEAKLKKILR